MTNENKPPREEPKVQPNEANPPETEQEAPQEPAQESDGCNAED